MTQRFKCGIGNENISKEIKMSGVKSFGYNLEQRVIAGEDYVSSVLWLEFQT